MTKYTPVTAIIVAGANRKLPFALSSGIDRRIVSGGQR